MINQKKSRESEFSPTEEFYEELMSMLTKTLHTLCLQED